VSTISGQPHSDRIPCTPLSDPGGCVRGHGHGFAYHVILPRPYQAGSHNPFDGLTRTGIDEISYKLGHRYLPSSSTTTRGRLVWPAVARVQTLNGFFDLLGEERCATIRLVSADAASCFPPPWRNSVLGHGWWSPPAMQSSNSFRTCAAVRFHVNSSAWDFAFARSSSETRLATSTARASASGPEPSITVA
jgi:hypothetical protein